jgi:23S rRNA (cytosine1962-C5)-methyltransferase
VVPGIARIIERRPEERGTQGEPAVLEGSDLPAEIEVHEGGVRFRVDLRRGHKTGLYLDQRDNHLRVAPLCRGAKVLNLFSYTGGFGLHAACAGATRVTNVDSGGPVIEAARRNFALNGLDPVAHEFVAEDALEWASRARRERSVYDVVVADPPSFAPSARTVPRALKAYAALLASATALVTEGGLLVAASCSSHVTEGAFLGVMARAASSVGRALQIVEVRGAGPDHPLLVSFPEGRYLTVAIGVVSGRRNA